MSTGQLAGKTAWVIGGGSGLGAASAVELAGLGAHVALSGRRVDALEKTRDAILAQGGSASLHPLDVEDVDALEAVAASIGAVDILVYSSGINVPRRSMAEVSKGDWNKIVNVNLNGPFNAAHTVLPAMRARGDGVIIIISSWIGWRMETVAGAAYATTKRGLLAMTEIINVEEGANGIRATCVCPAEVDTDVLNSRPNPPTAEARSKMLQPSDIGSVVGFVATAPARMVVNEIVVSPRINDFYRKRP